MEESFRHLRTAHVKKCESPETVILKLILFIPLLPLMIKYTRRGFWKNQNIVHFHSTILNTLLLKKEDKFSQSTFLATSMQYIIQ